MSGHIFPNGEKQLFITCQEGEWQVENAEWEIIPHCERKDQLSSFVIFISSLVFFNYLILLVSIS
jgi:hypothetical protein